VLASAKRLIVADDHFLDADPERRADFRAHLDTSFARALADALPPPVVTEWRSEWTRADRAARRTMDETLDARVEPCEVRVARDLSTTIPDGGTLLVGPSMPIRDLDYAMAPRRGLRVLANRGASGMDGFVSTVLGAACVSEGRTFALLGDLTFLHDVGAIMWNARRKVAATLVVLNNGGGTVFGFLPQRDLPEFERLFETRHGIDIGAVAAAAGVAHVRVETSADLVPAIRTAEEATGIHVVEVVVDPELNRLAHHRLQASVDSALAEL
jgi:2-succinyl-5-enolpyruvyl-6-hydroxy-3-cyclohexene-1-carboxylate synthase